MAAGDYNWQEKYKGFIASFYFLISKKVVSSFEYSIKFCAYFYSFTCDKNATFNAFRNSFSYVTIIPARLKSGMILRQSLILLLKFQLCSLLKQLLFFCSIWVFFHEHSQFTEQQEKREAISLTPVYHFQTPHRHLDINRAIT